MSTLPKISYLTVTNSRPEFMPWLLWNYKRQTYKNKELVIIDASPEPALIKEATVIHAPGANVPTMRNMALEAATGEYMTWMDDDDWHHPHSVKTFQSIIGDKPIAGGRVAWFVNLQTERVKRFVQRRGVLNPNMIMAIDVARSARFDEERTKGSDHGWRSQIFANHEYEFTYETAAFFLCHDRNMGNAADAHQFNRNIDDIQSKMTKTAWGRTGREMEKLRSRLWR